MRLVLSRFPMAQRSKPSRRLSRGFEFDVFIAGPFLSRLIAVGAGVFVRGSFGATFVAAVRADYEAHVFQGYRFTRFTPAVLSFLAHS